MGFIGQTSIINDFKNKIINKEVGVSPAEGKKVYIIEEA